MSSELLCGGIFKMEFDRYATQKAARELTRKERDTERGNVLVHQSRSKLQQPFLPVYCVVVFLARKRKKNTPSRRGIIIIDDE
jgi:hypothetical protein